MSSAIMTLLISHILTFVESEIVKAEPAIVANITQDIQSLIAKLEAVIAGKSTIASQVAIPVLNLVETAAVSAVEAAGTSVAQSQGS